jgi:23S rRNA (adenine-N6)-dimethyltransferase
MDVELPASPYKVFANIPYNTTAAIVTKLTDTPNPPTDAYLVVQEEAAHKFMGIPKETLYALMLKPWFKLSILHRFDRQDFVPVPGVDSVLLRIQPRLKPLLSPSTQNAYRDFVAHCFTHGSPSLYRLLEQLMGRKALNITASMFQIDRAVTPTALDFELWLCLFCQFWQHATPHQRRQILGSEQRLKCEQSRLRKWRRTR